MTGGTTLLKFTLDTNCIIDLDEERPDAPAIRQLIEAHSRGAADVAVVAMSASEKQPGNSYLQNFQPFSERLIALGLANLPLVYPMLHFDMTFFDRSAWSDDKSQALADQIQQVLFPLIEPVWNDYCRARGLNPSGEGRDSKWRNARCDVQALWSHIANHRDVFVTRDQNFHAETKKPRLISLGAGRIEMPKAAVMLL